MAESSGGVAADHNLDLSLGNSSSKHNNSQTSGNHFANSATDQHMQRHTIGEMIGATSPELLRQSNVK